MKKILVLILLLSLQTALSSNATLNRARLAKALFVTAGAAAAIGAYYANKIGDARYKAMYAQLYPSQSPQTYPNQNNRFLRTARNILTVLSGADTVDATALNGDTPPRLYRLFSSIPGWDSLAQKTGIKEITDTKPKIFLDTKTQIQTIILDVEKFTKQSQIGEAYYFHSFDKAYNYFLIIKGNNFSLNIQPLNTQNPVEEEALRTMSVYPIYTKLLTPAYDSEKKQNCHFTLYGKEKRFIIYNLERWKSLLKTQPQEYSYSSSFNA